MEYDHKHDITRKKRVVIKLSGSIFSQGASRDSIKKYAEMLSDISNSVQPIVITGGGEIARQYINLARNLGSDEANLDIMGIEVSRLNARLLIAALGDEAYSAVPKNLEEISIAVASNKIVIAYMILIRIQTPRPDYLEKLPWMSVWRFSKLKAL
jgi:uridylate kinase